MRKQITYAASLCMSTLLMTQSLVSADFTEEGFSAVPETCAEKELDLSESKVDVSFTKRDKNAEYEDAVQIVLSDDQGMTVLSKEQDDIEEKILLVEEKVSLSDGEEADVKALPDEAEGTGEKASAKAYVIRIKKEGVYEFSGNLSNGRIEVDADDADKVQIVLNNVDIHSENQAAIWIKEADKVFLTLAEESENHISDDGQEAKTSENSSGEKEPGTSENSSGEQEAGDDEHADADGAIFSKADLTIQGSGSLTVDGVYKHGVVSKDDLTITGGILNVSASEHCLCGKDAIKIAAGTLTLKAGEHAIKAKNEDDTQQGNIYIEGGSIYAEAGKDGINATGSIIINGGEMQLAVQDDGIHSDKDLIIYDGKLSVVESLEGLEGHRITIYGGSIDVKASDDGLNAAGDSKTTGFERQEGTQMPNGEVMQTPDGEAPQMLDGEAPQMSDGEALQMPGAKALQTPDGEALQMPGGRMRNTGGGMGFGGMDTDKEAYIRICGGNLYVDAEGDGIDSNGYFYMEGGTVQIDGPTGGGNSALDFGVSAEAVGGILIAAGSADMAQSFSSDSSQSYIFYNFDNQIKKGSTISLANKDGEEILSWKCNKNFQSLVITSPELTRGETCVISAGDEQAEINIS